MRLAHRHSGESCDVVIADVEVLEGGKRGKGMWGERGEPVVGHREPGKEGEGGEGRERGEVVPIQSQLFQPEAL